MPLSIFSIQNSISFILLNINIILDWFLLFYPFCFFTSSGSCGTNISYFESVFVWSYYIILFEVIIQYIIIKYNLLNDTWKLFHFWRVSSQNSGARSKHFYSTIVTFEMKVLLGEGMNIPVHSETTSQIL